MPREGRLHGLMVLDSTRHSGYDHSGIRGKVFLQGSDWAFARWTGAPDSTARLQVLTQDRMEVNVSGTRVYLLLLTLAVAIGLVAVLYADLPEPSAMAFPDSLNWKTDRGPNQVLVADLDLDDELDLITVNTLGGSLSVLLGRGDGTFGESQNHATGRTPYAAAVGRFTDDAYPDLVTTEIATSSLAIFVNDGHGSFGEATRMEIAQGPVALAVGRLDGDDFDDLVTVAITPGELWVYRSRGDGTFDPGVAYRSQATMPRSVIIADLDGDGSNDLASANDGSANVAVFLNRGDGTFADARLYPVQAGPQSIHAADLDGDGALDLATANDESSTVSVLKNRGDGTFEPAGDHPVQHPMRVSSGDIDGDGRIDLIVAERASNSVAVLLNRGDGRFQPPFRFPVSGKQVTSLTTGDFNRDGREDIVTSNMASDDVSVLLKGVPVPRIEKFTPAANAKVNLTAEGIREELVGRFNTELDPASLTGDSVVVYGSQSGYHRSALTYDATERSVTLRPNREGEEGSAPLGHVVPFRPGETVTVDFTHQIRSREGIPMRSPVSYSFTVQPQAGTGEFIEAGRINCVKIPGTLKAADMDNDGNVDVIALCREVDGIRVHFNAGNATFRHEDSVFLPTGGYGPWDLVPGDFNRDNLIDIAVVNTFSSDLTIFYNLGDRSFGPPVNIASGAGPMSLVSEDLDGDGYLDVVTVTKGFPEALIFINDQKGYFHKPVSYSVAPSPYDVSAKDLDGDGSPDLVMTNLESDRGTILMNNGDGTFRKAEEFPLLLAKALVEEPVDIDNDGEADIVTVNTASDDISIFLNTSNGGADQFTQQDNVAVGLTPTDKVFGDFNNDGYIDMAITLDGGSVVLLENNGDGSFKKRDNIAVGKNPTSPVSADFNNDGTLDLIVANQYSFDLSVLLNRPQAAEALAENGEGGAAGRK
jgi:FG-GAP-like repeat/Bacterial Ig-like domain